MKKVVRVMEQNEKGATLVYVLLLILVFSVLGMALMGNAVSETKRTEITESDMQAQHLALNGLTYFETAFEAYIEKTNFTNIPSFLGQYQDWVPVGPESNPNEMQIKAKLHLVDENNIEVWSKGTVGNAEKTFIGYYKLEYGMETKPGSPIYEIPDFTNGGLALNFSNRSVLSLGLSNILNLNLLQSHGTDSKFYRVPDEGAIKLGLLDLININIGDDERFRTVEENSVIATRSSTLLGLNLLGNQEKALVKINVLNYKDDDDTNVLINGGYTPISLLGGLLQYNKYLDIDFKKLAVMGNCLIQQDRDGTPGFNEEDDYGRRRFTFQEGLYVNQSLVIGGPQDRDGFAEGWYAYSKLMLRGDMLVRKNLVITDVDLQIGDSNDNEQRLTKDDYFSSMYVQGDAEINNACLKTKNSNYNLGLFVKGKLTLENNTECSTFPGLYNAEGGIEIKTNGKPMIIKGGLIGDVKVDNPDMLTIIEEYPLLPEVKITDVNLIPQGRAIEYQHEGS